MPYIGNQPAEQFTSFATQEFSTSATTSYTLDHAVTNENEIALFINNVRQQPGSGKAYTASGTALTLSAATASTDTMYAIYLGRALQTITPSTNSITSGMLGSAFFTGATDVGGALADADLLLIDDGAGGTLRKTALSRIKTYATGKLLQHKETSSSAVATGTTLIPEDDTIPQNDEGNEFITLEITPVSATSTMYITTQIFFSNGATTRTGIALFKDSGANALAFTSVFIKDATSMGNGVLRYAEVTGNTTARTYKIRVGGMGTSNATITFNGQSTNRKFGGIDTLSSIQILEVEA